MKFKPVKSIKDVKLGLVVRGRASGEAYIVTANYGDRATAVRTQDITNPDEWEIENRDDSR